MTEPEVPLKRKDQIAPDEQIARDIQAKLDAELIEEQKLARKQEQEANIALIESWENTQAMMEANRLLAERLQSKEREELTDEEKGKLFMELMEKRRKHFAALKLKGKSFDEIQKLFDKKMKRVNTFVAMGFEVRDNKERKVECSEETAKGSKKKMLGRKRAEKEQQQESSKKQRIEEGKESDEVDEASEDNEVDKSKWKFQEILFNDKDATRNRQRRLGGTLKDSKDKGRLRCKVVTKQIVGVVPKGLALRVVLVDLHSKDESGKGFKLEGLTSRRNKEAAAGRHSLVTAGSDVDAAGSVSMKKKCRSHRDDCISSLIYVCADGCDKKRSCWLVILIVKVNAAKVLLILRVEVYLVLPLYLLLLERLLITTALVTTVALVSTEQLLLLDSNRRLMLLQGCFV
ncbi:hypothetical protein Tco_0273337 [Tanacetum coccineum]